jgi:hypothetical protein
MVPVLNAFGVHYACIGNHDFDFGVCLSLFVILYVLRDPQPEELAKLMEKCKFPWLLSNVHHKRTGTPLGTAITLTQHTTPTQLICIWETYLNYLQQMQASTKQSNGTA